MHDSDHVCYLIVKLLFYDSFILFPKSSGEFSLTVRENTSLLVGAYGTVSGKDHFVGIRRHEG